MLSLNVAILAAIQQCANISQEIHDTFVCGDIWYFTPYDQTSADAARNIHGIVKRLIEASEEA